MRKSKCESQIFDIIRQQVKDFKDYHTWNTKSERPDCIISNEYNMIGLEHCHVSMTLGDFGEGKNKNPPSLSRIQEKEAYEIYDKYSNGRIYKDPNGALEDLEKQINKNIENSTNFSYSKFFSALKSIVSSHASKSNIYRNNLNIKCSEKGIRDSKLGLVCEIVAPNNDWMWIVKKNGKQPYKQKIKGIPFTNEMASLFREILENKNFDFIIMVYRQQNVMNKAIIKIYNIQDVSKIELYDNFTTVNEYLNRCLNTSTNVSLQIFK